MKLRKNQAASVGAATNAPTSSRTISNPTQPYYPNIRPGFNPFPPPAIQPGYSPFPPAIQPGYSPFSPAIRPTYNPAIRPGTTPMQSNHTTGSYLQQQQLPSHLVNPAMLNNSSVSIQPYPTPNSYPMMASPPASSLNHHFARPYPAIASSSPSSTVSNAPNVSYFGPGDPLFAANGSVGLNSSSSFSSRPSFGQGPLSPQTRPQYPPRPNTSHWSPLSDPSMSHSSSQGRRPDHETASIQAQLQGSVRPQQSQTNSSSSSSTPKTSHAFDDCPGCSSELEEAISASLASAKQDEEKRAKERERQELENMYAISSSEQQEQERRCQDEKQMLLKAIYQSQQEALLRDKQEDAILQESRLLALKQQEQQAQRELQELETAMRESQADEQRRFEELESFKRQEQQAIQESMRQQQEEWERRESAERSFLAFLEQRDDNDSSADLKQASPSSTADETVLSHTQADYWKFTGHNDAYELAMQMSETNLPLGGNTSALLASSSRRPLPLVPVPSASVSAPDLRQNQVVGVDIDNYNSDIPTEAPPAYEEVAGSIDLASPFSQGVVNHNVRPLNSNGSINRGDNSGDPFHHHHHDQQHPKQIEATYSRPSLEPRGDASFRPSRHLSPLASPEASSTQFPPAIHSAASNASFTAIRSPQIQATQDTFGQPTSPSLAGPPSPQGQLAISGIKFGYCDMPFSKTLQKVTEQALPSHDGSLNDGSRPKHYFPTTIQLTNPAKVTQASSTAKQATPERGPFYVFRANSWKSLLRAMAWYGNTCIEPGPEEVADAASRSTGRNRVMQYHVRIEIEFVTPSKVETGYGVGEYARYAQNTGVMPKASRPPMNVSVCLSLVDGSRLEKSFLSSPEYAAIKLESRRLDAAYASQGSTRRLIQLPSQAPTLPITLVQLAQQLHSAHTFSAACSTTSIASSHSPRDLHLSIERHDDCYLQKQKAGLTSQSSNLGIVSRLSSSSLLVSSSSTLHGNKYLLDKVDIDGEEEDGDDDDEDKMDFNKLTLQEGACGETEVMGKRERLKAKVKRTLRRKEEDGKMVDQDLATWITPFDLSNHG